MNAKAAASAIAMADAFDFHGSSIGYSDTHNPTPSPSPPHKKKISPLKSNDPEPMESLEARKEQVIADTVRLCESLPPPPPLPQLPQKTAKEPTPPRLLSSAYVPSVMILSPKKPITPVIRRAKPFAPPPPKVVTPTIDISSVSNLRRKRNENEGVYKSMV